VQAYDRDFFKSNDIIGEARINIRLAVEDSSLAKRPISINKKYYNSYLQKQGVTMDFKDDTSFWVDLVSRNDKGQIEKTGKVRMSIEILSKENAETNIVGEARSEPNMNPYLPTPVGRLSLSFNPIKLIVSYYIDC